MKRIVASVGIIALGVAGLGSASAQDSSKPWNASLSLRGFYDDNINTIGNLTPLPPGEHRASSGFAVTPNLGYIYSVPQTTIALNAAYTFQWYENKPANNTEDFDQIFVFAATVDHQFNERYTMNVHDSLVIGQEPDTLRVGSTPFSTIQRISGNNIVNYGGLSVNGIVTPLLGFSVGYLNGYYDYSNDDGNADSPSLSGSLDRIDETVRLDSRWTLSPATVGIFGYSFRWVNYTADEEIGVDDNGVVMSDSRNYNQNYLYVGAETTFNPQLTGALRIGASYINFYNAPNDGGNGWTPYLLASIRWNYHPKCFVEFGITHDISSTDVVGAGGNGFITSQEATTLYGQVNHQITDKLRGNVTSSFQTVQFQGSGPDEGETENYFLIGVSFDYQFTTHFSGNLGWNYDNVSSEINRSYDRNRVYIGLTAAY